MWVRPPLPVPDLQPAIHDELPAVFYSHIGKAHQLKEVPADQAAAFNIRIAYPPDDSLFVVYIGSDQPIHINAQESTPLDRSKRRTEPAME